MSPQDRAVIAADAVRQRLVVIEAACRAIVDLAEDCRRALERAGLVHP
jgi:hypothetical protein